MARQITIAALGVSGLVLAATASPATAQQGDFFKGKTISVYIGFSPGGGYDYYGRLVTRYLGKHIPGEPRVVAQNMPGAGSFTAANFLYSAAPKDGTALGVVTQTLAVEDALGTKGANYKAANFNWIGRVTAILEVTLTGGKAKAKNMADTKIYDTPVAGTGSGSPSEGFPRLMNGLYGSKFKVITGYQGSSDGMLAMDKGEVDGALTSWNTLKRTRLAQVKSGELHVLVQYGLERSPDPDIANVPAVVELGGSPQGKAIMSFYASGGAVGRSVIAPPGLPAERVKVLRTGFEAMLKDPDFLAEVDKLGVEFEPASGEQMQKLISDVARASPETIKRMQEILQAK
jgi:tripartite-type tricarboxylate transporter receptor subunit TctC